VRGNLHSGEIIECGNRSNTRIDTVTLVVLYYDVMFAQPWDERIIF
jgi:hypothetical protein